VRLPSPQDRESAGRDEDAALAHAVDQTAELADLVGADLGRRFRLDLDLDDR
jgi:hypothetical protein